MHDEDLSLKARQKTPVMALHLAQQGKTLMNAVNCSSLFFVRYLPHKVSTYWPPLHRISSLDRTILPLRPLADITTLGTTLGPQVRNIAFSWPVKQVIHLHTLPPPGLHPVLYFSHSVPKPHVQDPVISLYTGYGTL